MVHFLDHLYWKESARTNVKGLTRTYWRCIFWKGGSDGEKGFKCPGQAVSFSDGIQITAKHNHNGEKARVELKKISEAAHSSITYGKGDLKKKTRRKARACQAFVDLREKFLLSKNAAQIKILLDCFKDSYISRPTTAAKSLFHATSIWRLRLMVMAQLNLVHTRHWALIVIQIGNEEIGYYDSLNNDGTKSLHKIWEFLDTESMSRIKCGLEDSKWTYTSHQGIPLQQNGMIVASSLVSMLNACLEEALSTSISSI
uniref:Ubiquitin-like protease family profile domain-containing protein n=1 Tax=Ditylenchus dipsaci TaxID=166011 RepID=A0A915EM15_9BILA